MNLKKTIGIGTVVGLVAAGAAFMLLLNFSSVIVFSFTLPKFTQGLATDGGLNHWLAQTLALAFAAAMALGSFLIIKCIRSITGKVMVMLLFGCLITAGYSLTIYWLQCNRATAIQKSSASWNTNRSTKFCRAAVDRNTTFFNPVNGQPLIWYYRDENNRLEFFTSGGVHPQYNQPLKPIDAQTVKQLLTYLDTGRTDMVIGPEGVQPRTPSIAPAVILAPATDPTPQVKKVSAGQQQSKKKAKGEERPVHQVSRQQMGIELDHLKAYLCQAQATR